MTVHQFRHACAAIYLKHRPGEYEVVRRLLGHRNIQTTINFYCGLETTQANEAFGKIIRDHIKPHQRVFVGVVAPIDPHIETPEEVRDRVLEAAEYIPVGQLGTCDDCGFSPFSDDTSTTRDTAFAKIRARVEGTALAARQLGGE